MGTTLSCAKKLRFLARRKNFLYLHLMTNAHPFVFENIGLGIWHGIPYVMRQLHSHTAVEFNYVTCGGLTYRFAGETVKFRAGALYVFGGVTPHETIAVEEGTKFTCLTIPLAAFIRWRLPENVSAAILRGEILCDPDPEQDERRFACWIEDLLGDDPRRARITLLEVQTRLERMAISPSLATTWRRTSKRQDDASIATLLRVEQMLQTISARFADPLTLAEIAAATNWHPHYAAGQFRRWIGVPPGEFLLQQRVAHAKYLLALGDAKVMSIAEECGFASQSSFYVAFTRLAGMTPAAYRRNQTDLIAHD
jgi:AraC family transcriptional regulator, melibiose operon regulatory protein